MQEKYSKDPNSLAEEEKEQLETIQQEFVSNIFVRHTFFFASATQQCLSHSKRKNNLAQFVAHCNLASNYFEKKKDVLYIFQINYFFSCQQSKTVT